MHQLTMAALNTLYDVWSSIHAETSGPVDNDYAASLWRMAGHMCIAYAMQHREAGDHEMADQFEWLSRIADQRQLMALRTIPAEKPLKLAIVQSLNDVRH